VTLSHDGKTVPAAVGNVLSIELPSNPSSGYSWSIGSLNSSLLELVETRFVATREEPVPGSGGVQVWKVRALAGGRARISLKHWRAWEGESSVD
jgi:inhibitor of cysteine peptidase